MRQALLALLVGVAIGCSAEAQDVARIPHVAIEEAYPKLHFTRPLYLVAPPDGSDRVFLIEQDGRVLWWPNRADASRSDLNVALDIVGKVLRSGGEEGLLGMAFDPDFAANGHVYLHYSAGGPRRNVLSRWTMDEARETIRRDSEQVILEVEQPWSNHNGGHIDFGPDGYLYITLGDGGAGGDPKNHGQDKSTLLGSILRIDVTNVPNGRYAVPPDNPFVGEAGAAPEIWAYGLRNVWRFSFDPKTGDLWAGDVGQGKWEEIDIITRGGNYGWNVREGKHPYRGNGSGDFVDPVFEYDREQGISITGGYVYRGKAIPTLDGVYVYGDFGTGRVWGLSYDGKAATSNGLIGRVATPSSFGRDREGELYITSFNGKVYKLVPKR